jgi:hypothetical protein
MQNYGGSIVKVQVLPYHSPDEIASITYMSDLALKVTYVVIAKN